MREAKRRGRSQSDRQEMRIEMKGGVKRTQEKKGFINFRKTCKLACVGMYSSPCTLWIIPTALYHLHHSESPSLSVSHSSVCRPQLGCALEQMVCSVEQPLAVKNKNSLSIGTERASVQMLGSNI